MNNKEFVERLKLYEKDWESKPCNASMLIIEMANRINYLIYCVDTFLMDEGIDKNKEKSLIEDIHCPYEYISEPFVISHAVSKQFDIFYDGFWAYMAQEDPKFAEYCIKQEPYMNGGKKRYTYVQPKRALHYLMANGSAVTKNKIKKYFKIISNQSSNLCQASVPHEYVKPA